MNRRTARDPEASHKPPFSDVRNLAKAARVQNSCPQPLPHEQQAVAAHHHAVRTGLQATTSTDALTEGHPAGATPKGVPAAATSAAAHWRDKAAAGVAR